MYKYSIVIGITFKKEPADVVGFFLKKENYKYR